MIRYIEHISLQHLVGGIFYPVNMEAKTSQLSSQRWIPYYGYATGEIPCAMKDPSLIFFWGP